MSKLDTIPLLDAATAQLAALSEEDTITLTLSPSAAMILIAQLQLSLRHPANTGPASRESRQFIQGLRRAIAQPGDPLDILIGMGFREEFDQ